MPRSDALRRTRSVPTLSISRAVAVLDEWASAEASVMLPRYLPS